MKYILINTNEPKPFEEKSRLGRVGHISEILKESESEVVWITSNYSHSLKRYLRKSEKVSPKGMKIIFLFGLPYKKNISFLRILNNIFLGIQVFFYLILRSRDSKVLVSCPLIEVAFATILCSEIKQLKSIIDVRDDWPDSFEEHIPKPLRSLQYFLLYPWRVMLKYSFSRSNKLISMSEQQASFAKKYSNGRDVEVFYIGDNIPEISLSERSKSIKLFFIGTLSPARPLDDLISSLEKIPTPIELNIIGDGDDFERYREYISKIKIIMHGRKTGNELHSLVEDCDILLAPFAINYGFSLPTKISTYIGYGIPILTNLDFEAGHFLKKYELGSVVNFGNPEEVEVAINYWYEVDRIEHYRKSRIVYEDFFNIDRISTEITDLIHSI